MKSIHDQPFRPNNPAKKGYNKTLESFPKYQTEVGEREANVIKGSADRPPWYHT